MPPSSGETDVVSITSPAELVEETSTLNAPDAAQFVEHMLELVGSEATALLADRSSSDTERTERLADLNLRIALASWDTLHQPDAALRLLELSDGHPLAMRLRVMAAVDDPELLAKLPAATGALAIEQAEAWLWRHGDPVRAGDLADRLLAGDLPSAWRVHVSELAIVAHGARGNWPRVVELCSTGVGDRSPPEDIAATGALLIDRAGDPHAALELCLRKLATWIDVGWDAAPSTAGWLRCLDVALDAATQLGDDRRLELLTRRAELLTGLPGADAEAIATRMTLAAELDARGAAGEAAPLWIELADDAAMQAPGALSRFARLRATWSAAAATAPEIRALKLAAHIKLADSECAEVAATHAWRALELAAATNDPSLGDIVRTVADVAASRAAERWLDMIDVASPTSTTLARFAARGGLALRWAAAIAERNLEITQRPGSVPAQPLALWRRAAGEPDAPPTTRDHLARLLRDGDGDELSAAYRAWAAAEPDRRTVAALWCACGVVDIARGDLVEAEEALRRAASFGKTDPFCRAALAQVFRATKRHDQLAEVLGELASTLSSKEARTAASREHAELLEQQLGNAAAARAAFERLIADHPGDPEPVLSLARLCDRGGETSRAIALRQRAAELLTEPARKATLWRDIARDEERNANPDGAIAALSRAAEAGDRDALRDQARLHQAAGRPDRALELVRAELTGDPPLARRMQLQTQLAQLLTQLDKEPETVVAAYLDVLSIEPDQTEALVGIEAPARALGLWDELARAFRGAKQTPANLEVLAEALEKIAEWSELAEVRRRQLEAATTPADKAQRAGELARLYEQELGDVDAAARMLALAQQAQPDDARQQALLRLLRDGEKWSELATTLEREAARDTGRTGLDRQIELLLELGEIRATRLQRSQDAAAAYEAVRALDGGHPIANAELEKLYDVLGQTLELAQLLEARAEAMTGTARAEVYARAAHLRAQRGEIDAALASYIASFTADPTSRDVFTQMERVAYKAERWTSAMQLYDIAIAHVESGASRSYRLGDLYARRGNVQLNFLGDLEAAVASYQKVVEVDSQPEVAIKVLEDICRRRDDWQPLIMAYERRAETQRDSQRKIEALRTAAQLAHAHAPNGRDSVRLRRKLLDVDPQDLGAASELERFYEDNQDQTGLISVLKVRLQQSEDQDASLELHKKIARVSEEGARDVVTATEHYQKILELQPDNKEALEALGRIYESTERWAELIDITRKQIKVTADRNTRALLYFRCGSVMEAKFGREHDAIRYYDAAIKTSPSCLPAVHGMRDLYRRREEWPRVIETLELEVKLWQDDKERAGVFAQIGKIYDDHLGDAERAMTYYESALEVDPDCLPANQAMFEHHFRAGDWNKAQPIATVLAQKAMRDGDPSTRSDFYRKRGVVARHTGDPRAAAESFVVALEIKPANGEALDDLGALARERADVWDFESIYKELEKVYRKRDDAGPLLARVHVGRAAIRARDGDLDQATELYGLASELAPGDFTVLTAQVRFHADMRRWPEALAAIARFVTGTAASAADRVAALMQRAEIHADGELDTNRAIETLRTVLEMEPAHQDGYYVLAQQYYLSGRFADARVAVDRLIELATGQGQTVSPDALARYYYYKGRVLDAAGDPRAAASQYRRAIEYDPGYAPPALVLARRAAEAGDQRQAESLLIDAAHAAMARGGPAAAVPLQRGLARILLASGDRPAAIEAYRGILNVEPDGASDRVALAEIYAVDDPARAIGELRKVLDRDIHHAPAYRLLASFYSRTGDAERASRVLTALDLLGFAEDTDRATLQRLQAVRVATPMRSVLDDEARARLLLAPAAREPLGEVFDALARELSTLVMAPSLGDNLVPLEAVGETRVIAIADEVSALFQVEVEVFIGDHVPGLAAVTAFPRRLLVIDSSLLGESEPALRFLFGYAFEAIRGGYATLLQLGARPRRELGNLMRALMTPDSELTGAAAELLGNLNEHAAGVIERHADVRDVDPGAWIDGMLACAKRAGLVACDDFQAAVWTVALLEGEKLTSHHATVALGSVLGGPDLVRFYLSDAYQLLRDRLTV